MLPTKLKKWVQSVSYSKDTNYLINYWTLHISDKAIAEKVSQRTQNIVGKVVYPCLVFNVLSLLNHIYLWAMGKGPVYSVIMATLMFVNQICMNILWRVAPRHTGKVTTSFIFLQGLGLALFFHDMLGDTVGNWPDE